MILHPWVPPDCYMNLQNLCELYSLKCCWLLSSVSNHTEGIHAINAPELIGTVELRRVPGHTQ